jgi:hypothetical protein
MPSRRDLVIRNSAHIAEARVGLGDLSVIVGPQATGKSLALQWLKLAIDGHRVLGALAEHGFDWGADPAKLAGLFFGEGMESAWRPQTQVLYGQVPVDLAQLAKGRRRSEQHRLFYVPAHRALTISGGWPTPFRSPPPDTPFVVRAYGERVAEILTTSRATDGTTLFPLERRMKAGLRKAVDDAILHGASIELRTRGVRREVQIVHGGTRLSYMAWTAGQREFVPLLLGLYDALPSGKSSRRQPLEWVVIEEPEMGLHPKAILAVMQLVFELLSRGYKVVLSTHAPLILHTLWAVRLLRGRPGAPERVLEMLGQSSSPGTRKLAEAALEATVAVTYLDFRDDQRVYSQDISGLDPAAVDDSEAGWGGLTALSSRISDRLADALGGS